MADQLDPVRCLLPVGIPDPGLHDRGGGEFSDVLHRSGRIGRTRREARQGAQGRAPVESTTPLTRYVVEYAVVPAGPARP